METSAVRDGYLFDVFLPLELLQQLILCLPFFAFVSFSESVESLLLRSFCGFIPRFLFCAVDDLVLSAILSQRVTWVNKFGAKTTVAMHPGIKMIFFSFICLPKRSFETFYPSHLKVSKCANIPFTVTRFAC
jgi:hypothetical protein